MEYLNQRTTRLNWKGLGFVFNTPFRMSSPKRLDERGAMFATGGIIGGMVAPPTIAFLLRHRESPADASFQRGPQSKKAESNATLD